MTQKRINKTTNLIKVSESLLIYESLKWILRAIALSMTNLPPRHCEIPRVSAWNRGNPNKFKGNLNA